MIRVYSDQQQLGWPCYLALDSDGRVFVADYGQTSRVAAEQSPGTGTSPAGHGTTSVSEGAKATVLRRTNSSTHRHQRQQQNNTNLRVETGFTLINILLQTL